MILTVESIPNYLKEHWELIFLSLSSTSSETKEDALKGIEVTTIQGGMLIMHFVLNFLLWERMVMVKLYF